MLTKVSKIGYNINKKRGVIMDKIAEKENNIKKLGKILRESREKRGLSLRNVEDYFFKNGIKLTHTAIAKIEAGKVLNIDIRNLKEFVKLYKLDFNNAFELAGIDLKELNRIMKLREKDTMKRILLYGQASAGNGFINLDVEIGDFLIPDEDYKEGFFGVKVIGESMVGDDGNIPNGSTALINPNYGELIKDKVYVFTYKEETFIKQLIYDKQNIMRLHSFNKDYEDIIVLDKNELTCNGRLVKVYYNKEW